MQRWNNNKDGNNEGRMKQLISFGCLLGHLRCRVVLRGLALSVTESGKRSKEEGRMEDGEDHACDGDHP
jgi:hypothetical protein